ncbi:cytochrome c oxidase subunit IV [Coniophora puteana RWD-64-598 SS2]|uniref:Cytochrome c oxidase subunit IV n=1 Tax=Coniophora puteana (strain RWD-64-598) TaxID=741705 RepID=A0A5M3N191_CONPW|nr:cytochrome c oxidase subunit IV [Coniophora puteana RWD-64-598 SS2]EIW84651.1 cytochrome c oxidase subunit IV [Coniophora puteana RWD-64-598 SS2]
MATAAAATPSSSSSIIPLSNVEAQWEAMNKDEQLTVHRQLEEIQKKDWKTLSIDEKKAAYYVAFGPHGPRKPTSPPGENLKIFIWTLGLIGVSGAIFGFTRTFAPPPPKTMTKEWQEAENERAKELKLNPITGITSEDYKGPGFVTEKN